MRILLGLIAKWLLRFSLTFGMIGLRLDTSGSRASLFEVTCLQYPPVTRNINKRNLQHNGTRNS